MAKYFTLDELIQRSAFTGNVEALAPGYDERERRTPSGGCHLLDEGGLGKAADFLRLAAPYADALLSAARSVRSDEALSHLAWHCQGLLEEPVNEKGYSAAWPTPSPESDEGASTLWALVLLGALDGLKARYRERAIPESILIDTLSDFQVWMDHYKATTGRLGFGQVNWLRNHFVPRIFRLGRLQFAFEHFPFELRAFHRKPGSLALVDGAGRLVPAAGGAPGAKVFDPSGWTEVVHQGCPTLGIHIPASGPLDPVACGESIHAAFAFFPKYFPGYDWKAMTCVSWLLDPQLEKSLGPDANLSRFLREFYLFPVPGANDNQLWERVFGRRYDPWEEAPTDTSLRRAVIAHLRAGGKWANGGGLIVPEGYRWGGAMYREQAF
ncbi:MAG: DUF5596 domain-containing protein [Spirochaetes bacterium]|nr:DUF5596 domain-containing protein [Spirochaetota bacterium]